MWANAFLKYAALLHDYRQNNGMPSCCSKVVDHFRQLYDAIETRVTFPRLTSARAAPTHAPPGDEPPRRAGAKANTMAAVRFCGREYSDVTPRLR